MRRFVIAILGTASLVVAGYMFKVNALDSSYDDRPGFWWELGIPMALFIAGIFIIAWGIAGNVYRVKEGEVVRHRFSPAHWMPMTVSANPVIIIPYWVNETWEIQVQDDNGHKAWFAFSTPDIFKSYPVGSHYR